MFLLSYFSLEDDIGFKIKDVIKLTMKKEHDYSPSVNFLGGILKEK